MEGGMLTQTRKVEYSFVCQCTDVRMVHS